MLVYFGPEVLVPLASAAAAVGGFFLLTWRKISGFFLRLMGKTPPAIDEQVETPAEEPQDTPV